MDCSGNVLLLSGNHFLIKLSKGLTLGVSTWSNTSLKVRGAEWLNALLNEGLGHRFFLNVLKRSHWARLLITYFECIMGCFLDSFKKAS